LIRDFMPKVSHWLSVKTVYSYCLCVTESKVANVPHYCQTTVQSAMEMWQYVIAGWETSAKLFILAKQSINC